MKYAARAPLVLHLGGDWTDGELFAKAEGGVALSAAITRYAAGSATWPSGEGPLRALRSDRSTLQYETDVPPGADLGEEAARILVWITLTRTPLSNTWERLDISMAGWRTASILDILVSSGDVHASALGGISYLTFGESVSVDRLALDSAIADDLRSRLLLVYVGESRLTPAVHAAVWDEYRALQPRVVAGLRQIKELAEHMRLAVIDGDLDGLGSLVRDHWEVQKGLHAAITNPAIDRAVEVALRNGALAARASGRGASGSVLVVVRRGERERARSALATAGFRVLDFDFDTYGVFLKKA